MQYVVIKLDLYIVPFSISSEPQYVSLELSRESIRLIRHAKQYYDECCARLSETGLAPNYMSFGLQYFKVGYEFLYGEFTEGIYNQEQTDAEEDMPESPIDSEDIYTEIRISDESKFVAILDGCEYFCSLPAEIF